MNLLKAIDCFMGGIGYVLIIATYTAEQLILGVALAGSTQGLMLFSCLLTWQKLH